jgi:hypothetical protein
MHLPQETALFSAPEVQSGTREWSGVEWSGVFYNYTYHIQSNICSNKTQHLIRRFSRYLKQQEHRIATDTSFVLFCNALRFASSLEGP